MQKNRLILLLIISGCFGGSVAGKIQPVIINPTATSFDSLPSYQTDLTFFVEAINDTLPARAETGKVGETRVRRRKYAPIICKPLPQDVVKQSLESLFFNKGMKAPSADSCSYLLQATVFDFRLEEISKKLTQTMNAYLVLQVKLVNPSDTVDTRQFVIKTQNSKSTLDTSKHAEAILRGALESALKEILKNISK